MKQLKTCTIGLIKKQCLATAARPFTVPTVSKTDPTYAEEYEPGAASFSRVYEKLPQILSKNMSDALSPSVAYYAILHLCNDNKLRLIADKKEGFFIRQIKDD